MKISKNGHFWWVFRCLPEPDSLYLKDCSAGAPPSLHTFLSGGHVTFQVGDKVIYPNHGLGVVQGIETKTILGTTCGFYHLRMVANETTVLVPVDNVDGLRRGRRQRGGSALRPCRIEGRPDHQRRDRQPRRPDRADLDAGRCRDGRRRRVLRRKW